MKRKVFREVRILIYVVIVANALLVQYILPLDYQCNYNSNSCPMCGMRTAIDYMIQLDFQNAVSSNPYFLAAMVVGVLMLIDTVNILYKFRKEKT